MSGQAMQNKPSPAINAYPYDALPRETVESVAWDLSRVDVDGRPAGGVSAPLASAFPVPVEFERRLAEESRRSFESGRQLGMEDGRAAERAAQSPAEQHRAEQIRRLLDDVASGRDRYVQAVEHEVVRLALVIAARILRREVQMDPLLLMGAVRVALGQLAAATEVRLHVPAADCDLWKEAVALVPNPPVRPSVVADDALRLGECRLETSLGEVDLGLRAQLGEIERGFFDPATAEPSNAI